MRNDDYTGVSLGDLLRDQIDRSDSVGAVITFRPGIDRVEADRILAELARRGIINTTYAHEYDSSMGSPVWYIP